MRAALCSAYGPPEVVQVADLGAPPLELGHLRVRVHAAAVNFADVLMVAGDYQIKVPPPFVPGSELAGEIIEIADDVTSVSVGDRVFGTALVGAFAQEATVAATSVTRIPERIESATAAAFGVAHRTAIHSLRSVARLQPGEELVVLGAGGGVGLAAVQLGAVFGARVTAVASSDEKLAVASAMGATRTLNYKGRDLRAALKATVPNGADVVLDPVGGDLSEPALRSLRWGGRFVTVGYASGTIPRIPLNLVLLKGVSILGFEFGGFASHMIGEMVLNDVELLDLMAAGRAAPHIGKRFPLDDTAAALRYVADGHAIGKVVLEMA